MGVSTLAVPAQTVGVGVRLRPWLFAIPAVVTVLAPGVLAAGPGVSLAQRDDEILSSRAIVVLHASQLQRSVDNDGTVTTVKMQEHLCGQLVQNLYFECEP